MSISIPEAAVGKTYLNDPESEDCIYGDELQDGMVIVLADSFIRFDYKDDEFNPATRWCRVTRLRRHGSIVSFIGVYSNGSSVPRSYNVSYAWYVKKAVA